MARGSFYLHHPKTCVVAQTFTYLMAIRFLFFVNCLLRVTFY